MRASYSKHVGFFCCFGIVCFGRRSHELPICRSQNWELWSFTYGTQFRWGFFFPLDKVKVVHTLVGWIWKRKELVHMLLAPWKKEISQNDLMWPSNFGGNGLHQDLLKKKMDVICPKLSEYITLFNCMVIFHSLFSI